MKKIKLHIKGLIERIMRYPRRIYHQRKAKRFIGPTPSIICNNCLGGIMLHDLGMPFNTPTINLFFAKPEDYLYFVQNLSEFQSIDFKEISIEKYNYPAGSLVYKGFSVDVVFMHYKSFEHGRAKWIERFKRVDFNNLFVIYENPEVDSSFIIEFSKLQCKKAIISKHNPELEQTFDFYIPLDIYNDWHPGKAIEYKKIISLKRNIDDWDYINYYKA